MATGSGVFDKHPPSKIAIRIGTVSKSGDLQTADCTVLLDGEPYQGRISGKFFGITSLELLDPVVHPNTFELHMLVVSNKTPAIEATDRLYLDRFPDTRPQGNGLAPELELPQYVRD